jgi:hypothetical protein
MHRFVRLVAPKLYPNNKFARLVAPPEKNPCVKSQVVHLTFQVSDKKILVDYLKCKNRCQNVDKDTCYARKWGKKYSLMNW